jgi:hypothetical protein
LIRARLHRICPGVGAVLALLTLVSPLLVTFHEAAVRHVTCPEHGELVDAPLEAPHPHGHPSTGLPGLFAEGDPSGPSGPGEEHEHCAVNLHGQLRATEQSRKPFVVTTPEVVTASPRERPRLRGLAVYRLAPKASPPLA